MGFGFSKEIFFHASPFPKAPETNRGSASEIIGHTETTRPTGNYFPDLGNNRQVPLNRFQDTAKPWTAKPAPVENPSAPLKPSGFESSARAGLLGILVLMVENALQSIADHHRDRMLYEGLTLGSAIESRHKTGVKTYSIGPLPEDAAPVSLGHLLWLKIKNIVWYDLPGNQGEVLMEPEENPARKLPGAEGEPIQEPNKEEALKLVANHAQEIFFPGVVNSGIRFRFEEGTEGKKRVHLHFTVPQGLLTTSVEERDELLIAWGKQCLKVWGEVNRKLKSDLGNFEGNPVIHGSEVFRLAMQKLGEGAFSTIREAMYEAAVKLQKEKNLSKGRYLKIMAPLEKIFAEYKEIYEVTKSGGDAVLDWVQPIRSAWHDISFIGRFMPYLKGKYFHAIEKGESLDLPELSFLMSVNSNSDMDRSIRLGLKDLLEAYGVCYFSVIDPQAETLLPADFADLQRLERILLNLVSNGIKYSDAKRLPYSNNTALPKGEELPPYRFVRRKVYLRGDRVVFEIKDNGRGISPEGVAQYGIKPWRDPTVIQEGIPGQGDGSMNVRHLIEELGGEIEEIVSNVGVGTKIRFSIHGSRFNK